MHGWIFFLKAIFCFFFFVKKSRPGLFKFDFSDSFVVYLREIRILFFKHFAFLGFSCSGSAHAEVKKATSKEELVPQTGTVSVVLLNLEFNRAASNKPQFQGCCHLKWELDDFVPTPETPTLWSGRSVSLYETLRLAAAHKSPHTVFTNMYPYVLHFQRCVNKTVFVQ